MATMRIEFASKLKTSKFVQDMTKGNYVTCPNYLLLGYKELTGNDKMLYLQLLRFGLMSISNNHVESTGNPIVYPCQETLAKLLNVSQASVSRGLARLQASSLITRRRRGLGQQDFIILHLPKPPQVEKKPEQTNVTVVASTIVPFGQNEEVPTVFVKDSKKVKTTKANYTVEEIIAGNTGKHKKDKATAGTSTWEKQDKTDRRSTKTLLTYFETEYTKKFGTSPFSVPKKDMSLLKKLLENYSYEKIQLMMEYAICYWERFKFDRKIVGELHIGVIFGFHNYLSEKADKVMASEEPSKEGGFESEW